MTGTNSSLLELLNLIEQKAPNYFNLLTAKTDAKFEAAFDAFLENAISHLETNKVNFQKLSEEGLSGVLVAALSMPGLSVTQETHSNGHVDITIVAEHCTPIRRKLGEAKIYDGPAYHFQGLQQLLGRYSTGREGRGVLISYIRKKGIADLIGNLRKKMDSDYPNQQQGQTIDHVMKWSFLSTHAHSSGEKLEVTHVGCNLYVESATQSSQSPIDHD